MRSQVNSRFRRLAVMILIGASAALMQFILGLYVAQRIVALPLA